MTKFVAMTDMNLVTLRSSPWSNPIHKSNFNEFGHTAVPIKSYLDVQQTSLKQHTTVWLSSKEPLLRIWSHFVVLLKSDSGQTN